MTQNRGRHRQPASPVAANAARAAGKASKPAAILILSIALLAVSAAVAAYLSQQVTATDNMTAAAVGNVDIGDAATEGLLSSVFGYEPAEWTPGTTADGCMVIAVDGTGTSLGDLRAYASSIGGSGLADYIDVEIRVDTSAGAAGHIDPDTCINPPNFTWEAGDTKYTGTLANLPLDYPNGLLLASPPAGSASEWLVWVHMELPDTQTVNDNTQGLSASVAAVFENQN